MKDINKYALIAFVSYIAFGWAGCKKDETTFNIIPPSAGDTITLSGIVGTETGDSALNSVFVDLSKVLNPQTSVLRTSWDLGFYSGTEFKVIINHSTGASVYSTGKTELTAVSKADSTAAVLAKLTLNGTTGDASTIDPVTGNFTDYLKNTVITEVSATARQNLVYILNPGKTANIARRPWIKFQVTRTNTGYLVTYGTLDLQLFNTVNVVKDGSYNFRYASLRGASSNVEPGKKEWDIEWGGSTYKNATNPVYTPDFVLINFAGGVTAAKIDVTSALTYATFSEADLNSLNPTFSGDRDVIGTSWVNLTSSTKAGLIVNTDRFYLIKDAAGNVYKLNFGGGSRGRPIIQYVLVKAAITA